MSLPSLPGTLWWVAGALLLLNAGLFAAARRPVALRLHWLGIFCAALLAIRAVLWGGGYRLQSAGEVVLLGIVACGAALMLARRVWLVRDSLAELRERIQAGARGLFLQYGEVRPGRFEMQAREGTRELRAWAVGSRLLVVVVPRVTRPSKAALFVSWLSKQYPGPIPKVRIVLSRSQS